MIFSQILVILSVTISIPFTYCVPVSDSERNLTICIDNGCLQGKTMEVDGYDAFLGIPFAEPPIGNLRFAVSDYLIFYFVYRTLYSLFDVLRSISPHFHPN